VLKSIEDHGCAGCRFSDCGHQDEPGCAVRAALEDGTLDPDRLRSYRKLQRELAFQRRRQRSRERRNSKRRWKGITKAVRQWKQEKDRW
jgi:ribosome biogenesis GTPase